MNYIIREMKECEYPLLNEFLYEALFVPEGAEMPAKSVLDAPELQVYIEGFGTKKDDCCIVAQADNKTLIGAAWVRIMNDYGHIDDETPSLAISLYKHHRGLGIGTAMLNQLFSLLKMNGYKKTSLSVQKENYAAELYKKLGYEIVAEHEQDYLMVKNL